MDLRQFQRRIADLYGDKDRRRGVEGTFIYLVEEMGELATALREGSTEEKASELADVLAWTVSVAQCAGIDLSEAVDKKYSKCPGCQKKPCVCKSKP